MFQTVSYLKFLILKFGTYLFFDDWYLKIFGAPTSPVSKSL